MLPPPRRRCAVSCSCESSLSFFREETERARPQRTFGGTSVALARVAYLPHGPHHRLPILEGQCRTPGVVAGLGVDDAVCRERPQHPADVAFHRCSESRLRKGVYLHGKAEEGVRIAVSERVQQPGL